MIAAFCSSSDSGAFICTKDLGFKAVRVRVRVLSGVLSTFSSPLFLTFSSGLVSALGAHLGLERVHPLHNHGLLLLQQFWRLPLRLGLRGQGAPLGFRCRGLSGLQLNFSSGLSLAF